MQSCLRRRRDHFEIRISRDDLANHVFERVNLGVRHVLIQSFDFETEARGKIFLITDHHVDILGDFSVHLTSFFDSADTLP